MESIPVNRQVITVGASVSLTAIMGLAFYLGGLEARVKANEKAIDQIEKLTTTVSELNKVVSQVRYELEQQRYNNDKLRELRGFKE